MASFFTAVLLMCFVYMVLGAGVYTQYDIQKTPRDIRTDRRDVNVVKRSGSTSGPTFENETVGRDLQKDGNPVFLRAIERHEGVFLNSTTGGTFQEKMKTIYETRESKWKGQREAINADLTCEKSKLGDSDKVDDFYGNIIKQYTAKDGCVYGDVNEALRAYITQSNSSVGSFALLLNVVLTQWTSLSSNSSTTYLGVGDSFNIEPYTANTTFTWTGFTSSSTDMDVACRFATKGLFIIDNSAVSEWRPRGIRNYSNFPTESEYLYPATAIFNVTSVEDGACQKSNLKTIHISLQTDESKKGNTETGQISRASTIGGTLKRIIPLVIVAAIVVIFE